ncbi:MAG TPA: ribose 5-phosphate isomerase B [Bacteroidales bacterium]|nr:ribose 5-phosphate isomerase B [Bacteroidales bacterium]HOE04488.1 ribose 5-phosphate isomerase B [Bacteroidales bacterium]HQL69493.1 ribose 5-phosphate isomerase B [Bacteroidales bacterium]
MEKLKIGFACDHAGFQTKEFLFGYVEGAGHECTDFGCHSEESCDYPDFAHTLALAIERGDCDLGIAICGSGNGISMTLNKHAGIRAALCWNPEIASLARLHNNANVCSLPARFVNVMEAADIIDAFLNTGFEGGRHQRRIDKIPYKNN